MALILLVDDDRSLREFLEIFLKKEGYSVLSAANAAEALNLLKAHEGIRVVISDIRMPDMSGIELLRHVKALRPELPVVLITAFASMDTAISAMKEGAWDYLTKPFRLDEVRRVLQNALSSGVSSATTAGPDAVSVSDRILHARGQTAEASPGVCPPIHRLDAMVACSPAMLKVFQLIKRVASSPSSVLITGESGTGKELVARALHNLGNRASQPFVVVNCGGIPENLLETELFGHVKGAFTGADREKVGLFALADTGTLFLDEIGELPMSLQVKLLRVVQQKTFMPVGGTREQRVDVRIVAATNRDLEQEVMAKRFREDLFYRLNVIHIHIPPLRERPEDIPVLVQYFLDKFAREQGKSLQGISSFAMQILQGYSFPGNVRELENIVERSVALETSGILLPESLSISRFKEKTETSLAQQGGKGESSEEICVIPSFEAFEIPREGMELDGFLARIEKTLILKALQAAHGSKTEAARLLKINFRSFRYRLDKYGIE
ncbi:MAG: sigma-54 dependent transcriptional regulator [Deltaproteobacteria bacterium]|nr:sigma-54 dependent transcriptional regulator [Deltaproteobacteria bacterium]